MAKMSPLCNFGPISGRRKRRAVLSN